MIKRLLYRPETILFLLLLLITYQFKWKKDDWRYQVLSSDGRGYYAYLTAAIIYNDFSYESSITAINEQLKANLDHHCILQTPSGKKYNKTFPGVAICMMPMFFIAYFLSFLFGLELNGYSDLFLISIQLSAILSAIIGFYFLKKLLIVRNINYQVAIFSSFLCVFGSNIYFNATDFPSMSHIYSFAAISTFLFLLHKAINQANLKYTYLATALLCLIFLIRPTNIVIILLAAFLAESKTKLLAWLKLITKIKSIFAILSIGISAVSILPILWYIQTGSPIIWSYSGEGFYWGHPLAHKVLFSFRNGAYIYSPLAFVGLFGMIPLWIKNKFSASFGITYYVLNLYIISAWWTYYYGGGFGHRAMSDHFIFSFILLPELFTWKPKIRKIKTEYFLLPFAFLSLLQGYQMNKGILSYDYINWKMYSSLFLKIGDKYKGECGGTHDCHPFGNLVHTDYKKPDNNHIEEILQFNSNREFGGDLMYKRIPDYDNSHLFLEFNYTKKRLIDQQFDDVYFVVDGLDIDNQTISYRALPLYDLRSEALNEFKAIKLELQLSDPNVQTYKFYIWNKGHQSFILKDLDFRLHYYQP